MLIYDLRLKIYNKYVRRGIKGFLYVVARQYLLTKCVTACRKLYTFCFFSINLSSVQPLPLLYSHYYGFNRGVRIQ